jgi:UDP-N-acetylmuramate: L-alanyl-gamma-D-glutamyl-meso-diaminopimelate ligase
MLENIAFGLTTSFDLYKNDAKVTSRISTSLLGKHNIQNIVGVAAILLETGKLTIEEIIHAIAFLKASYAG